MRKPTPPPSDADSAAQSSGHYQHMGAWLTAMDLAEACYHVTNGFPREELIGMTSQIRRASAIIPAKIAEGQGRGNPKEQLRLLGIARGSLLELETHLLLSNRVGLLPDTERDRLMAMTEQVSQLISELRRLLRKRIKSA